MTSCRFLSDSLRLNGNACVILPGLSHFPRMKQKQRCVSCCIKLGIISGREAEFYLTSGKRDSTRPPCHGVARKPGEDGSPLLVSWCGANPAEGTHKKGPPFGDELSALCLSLSRTFLSSRGKRDSTCPPCHGVARKPGEDGSPLQVSWCGANPAEGTHKKGPPFGDELSALCLSLPELFFPREASGILPAHPATA